MSISSTDRIDIAFEKKLMAERQDREKVSVFVSALEKRTHSMKCAFRPTVEDIHAVASMFVTGGLLSPENTAQQFEDAITDAASALCAAFFERRFLNWATKCEKTEFAARKLLNAADMMSAADGRVENAEKIATALHLNGTKPVSRSNITVVAIVSSVVAVLACIICVCLITSSGNEKTNLTAANTVTTQSAMTTSDNYVYVTPSGKKYHKQGCWTLSKSKNLKKLTLEEAESKRYEPCSVCFDG